MIRGLVEFGGVGHEGTRRWVMGCVVWGEKGEKGGLLGFQGALDKRGPSGKSRAVKRVK